MIDIHSHILPSIDDGSKDIEETKKVIQEAINAGFEGIVLTSHYIEGYYEADVKEREKLIRKIQKIQNIQLYIGNEVYFTENMIQLLEDKKISTINNTRYILFEIPFNIKPMNIYDIIYEMMQHKLIPILAHPERYTFIWKQPDMIFDLIEKGVLMQANYGSIIGQYGKQAQLIVEKFLLNDMIHFLGTDAHKPESIYTQMTEVLQKLEQLIGKEKLQKLSKTNPDKMIHNEKIDIPEPTKFNYTLTEKWVMNQARK